MKAFLLAGEHSGDLHGSRLIQSLNCPCSGVGGPLMRHQNFTPLLNMEEFDVMGFTDVIEAFPRLWGHFKTVRDAIMDSRPDVTILIDYPGFNLRLAQSLRKKGYRGKIVQYICPTVWAWGKGRIPKMANTIDLILSIYPFEEKYLKDTSLNIRYVGNPLTEMIAEHSYHTEWHQKHGIDQGQPLLALFPGSRHGEIQRNLPIQLDAAKQFHDHQIAISVANAEHFPKHLFQKYHCIPKDETYDLMRHSQYALATSGTVNLELALHQTPTVVTYKLSLLNYLMARYIIRLNLPHYSIVNILAGETVFPELMDKTLSADEIANSLKHLSRERCIEQCQKIMDILGTTSSSQRAVNAIMEL